MYVLVLCSGGTSTEYTTVITLCRMTVFQSFAVGLTALVLEGGVDQHT